MSDELKQALIKSDCKEHADEFGECEGIVGETFYEDDIDKEVDVYWQPYNIKFAYNVNELIKL